MAWFSGPGSSSGRSHHHHHSGSSSYRRSPREGYVRRAYEKLRRLLRDLMRFARRNPMKVFMMVIMPLITGGALTKLLSQFGIRLPAMFAGMAGGRGGSYGGRGSSNFGAASEAFGSLGGGALGGGGIQGLVKLAQMFM